ncbi:predicted protein [Aspergillus nidulans FGSC A4]|uniref:Uncharacterized protein n=1 Tax=Emericella nidulans (strain FGSC A4 / ATCC 38163 / CBS 112.46 / NRRL 194 / M139) TaxID=227321 RepID=Q5AVK5_EMENI|nr:hypothetical protein [Aspergillus nidulans FGSC A4]EAA61861.1 predicted protein [Aspergillus nidulans FGSC A4]CBF79879.1 TPA: conserved hypothetical protein [Aspergillus nidulans FGSC A4]|eukprot:XP_680944.1 predicted protein [Aspergillus nidulans FGSC A4]
MSPVLIALTFILTLVIPQSALTQAQLRYLSDSKTNHLLCPAPNKQYCAAASLQSSSIISFGFERAGVCYESSLKSGDAVCAFNGTGYTREGLEVNAPETILCDGISSFSIIPPFAENHSKREGEGGTTSIEYFSSSQSPVPILRAHENLGQYPSYFPIQV